MTGDNRIFNVNGKSEEYLLETLQLALKNTKVEGWKHSPNHGLILFWAIPKNDKKVNRFPAPLNADAIFPIVTQYLKSEDASKVECKDWDADADHDGHNERGWRVYCTDWGHVGNECYALIAIKPAYIWYGK